MAESKKGTIGVSTENIFPIIKKFLYSDHEIFLRELVSNAVDATTKLKTLSSLGEYSGVIEDLKVSISLDTEAKTLTISDNGIGMTKEEIEKYINQIAFSGAEEFMQKYQKDANGIIGHFGLGFYSSFMVAKDVEIKTLSYKEGSTAVKWQCDGSPEYTLEDIEKEGRGTDIILHLADDSLEFNSKEKITELLNKYCKFLPVPVVFGKKQEWKDGKYEDTADDNQINNPNPIWAKTPSTLEDKDYQDFYRELYPMGEAPLFNIHLNVDYPFNLTGVLYFPKINKKFDLNKNKIQLYCNQVFVTDSVEGVVPDFLQLLNGVLDSPDIPLNVSRSYLQSDSNVKKISSHITKKVADKLHDLFKKDREDFQSKWDDLKLLLQYGVISNESFAEKVMTFFLFKNSLGEFFTSEEYQSRIKDNQTDKDGNIIILYSVDKEAQSSFIKGAVDYGYDVLVSDSPLETHFISHYESKNEKVKFARVDSDTAENLIKKDEVIENTLSVKEQDVLVPAFSTFTPEAEGLIFRVTMQSMKATSSPCIVTQDEFMRRMRDQAAVGGSQYSFLGDMPVSYNIVINPNHKLVKGIVSDITTAISAKLESVTTKINSFKDKQTEFNTKMKDKKQEEWSAEENEAKRVIDKEVEEATEEKNTLIHLEAKKYNNIKQLMDLALLSNGLLKGSNLDEFIQRSTELLK